MGNNAIHYFPLHVLITRSIMGYYYMGEKIKKLLLALNEQGTNKFFISLFIFTEQEIMQSIISLAGNKALYKPKY